MTLFNYIVVHSVHVEAFSLQEELHASFVLIVICTKRKFNIFFFFRLTKPHSEVCLRKLLIIKN